MLTHASPSATRPETEEFESQREPPMGSSRREPPTPTRHRRRSHHATSCFTGSIELQSAPLSTADSERQWAHTASSPLTPAPLMIAPPFLFSFSFFASRFFSFGAFNVWTTLVLNCSYFFIVFHQKKKSVVVASPLHVWALELYFFTDPFCPIRPTQLRSQTRDY